MTTRMLFSAATICSIIGTGAFAQDAPVSSSTQTTTTTTDNGSYVTGKTKSETQHSIDADGTEITKSKTYRSGDGALTGTSRLEVKSPDGLSRTVERQETSVPAPVTSTSSETTTTTIEH